jgi:hypothetical protein
MISRNHSLCGGKIITCVCACGFVRAWVWVHRRGRISRIYPCLFYMQRVCPVFSSWLLRLYRNFRYYKRHGLWEKKIADRNTWVLSFSTTFIWNIFHSKNNSATFVIKLLYVKRVLFLSDFNKIWIFTTYFR